MTGGLSGQLRRRTDSPETGERCSRVGWFQLIRVAANRAAVGSRIQGSCRPQAARHRAMPASRNERFAWEPILIDKLLQTVVSQGASDLHIAVGQPPVLRLHGHMRSWKPRCSTGDDTVALMKSITPDRCQQELQEVGGIGLRLCLRHRGPFPRVDLQAAGQHRPWCCGRFPTSC